MRWDGQPTFEGARRVYVHVYTVLLKELHLGMEASLVIVAEDRNDETKTA